MMTKYLSSRNTRLVQIINLFVFGFLTFCWLIFFLISPSVDTFFGGFIGVFIFGILNYFHLKIIEVALTDKTIIIERLFSKTEIEKDNVDKIYETIISPFLYKIVTKDGIAYYFNANEKDFLETYIKFESGALVDKLNKVIEQVWENCSC